ncbi:hypothetical protein WS52_04640 [Burkholderia territorii]|nr:hypothetical protein WS52_04640 [Burkholderia territorii]
MFMGLADAIGRTLGTDGKQLLAQNLREQAAFEADRATTQAQQMVAPLFSMLAEAVAGDPEKGLAVLQAAIRQRR